MVVVIVVSGFCRMVTEVGSAAELDAVLEEIDIEALVARRRVPPFEADASTILAHWIRSAATEDALIVELDRNDLSESLTDARAELEPLLASLG